VGWARPAQLTGLDSAQKGVGRYRPSGIWANLGPTKSYISVWARPGPNSRAGPESVWPTNTSEMGQNPSGPEKGTHQCWARTGLAQHWKINQWGGNYFPPILLHAERTFCMQEENAENQNE